MHLKDMQEDFLYALMQIKNGKHSEKDYERIKSFIEFVAEKIIKSSHYSEDLTVDFAMDAVSKSLK